MSSSADSPDRFPVGASVSVAELTADPHPALARLRAAEPVSWVPALDGWVVTRHASAEQVMRAPELFTVDDPRFSTAQVVGPSMLSLDGPEHTRHRTPFAHAFRPAEVRRRFAPFVQDEVVRLIAGLPTGPGAELRARLAGPLSVAVVAQALGLAGTDARTVLGWYETIVRAVSDLTAGQPVSDDAGLAYRQLTDSVEATIAAETHSLLATARAGLSLPETVSNAAVLMFGGIDTTAGMICNVILHVLSDPAVLAELTADETLIPAAVEESLRLEPAAAVVDRFATADVTLDGARIRAGELVVVSVAAANRDPELFERPDEFSLRRRNSKLNLSFARGPHFCPAMDLARVEAGAVLTALLAQFPLLRLDTSFDPSPRGLVFRRPEQLHVRWD